MLTIAFRFSGGRYHATPWGRHVNEADVEWPPSPWRIARALIATWHRKIDKALYPKEQLHRLLEILASEPPCYRLPNAIHAHTRHYMPTREGTSDKNTLIFDGFLRVDPNDSLIVSWQNITLDEALLRLLDELLENLSYLGRAESWVEAKRYPDWTDDFNCMPGDTSIDPLTGEIGEVIPLFSPKSPDTYSDFLKKWSEKQTQQMKKGKKKTTLSLPNDWIEAISLETGELKAAGWSQPPAAQKVFYRRPINCLKSTVPGIRKKGNFAAKQSTTIRFALYGKPLPRMEHAIRFGELVRIALMHQTNRWLGRVPAFLSGHELPQDNNHAHAFFLPEGNDRGEIDHFLVHSPGGFLDEEIIALQQLTKLFDGGSEWQTFYEEHGEINAFSTCCSYAKSSQIWRTVTPYLHPWHYKKKFGYPEQIIKECRLRGIQEPVGIRKLDEIMIGSQVRRPIHFYRFRRKRGVLQPDILGSFVELVFSKPQAGPIALGFGCHLGLGLFAPA